MERQIEATQAWVDLAAWQVKEGKDRPADFAMLKVQATRMLEAVAREAAQVLGGASYITGSKVERSEEHTSELRSLMRSSHAVFCWKKQQHTLTNQPDRPLTQMK